MATLRLSGLKRGGKYMETILISILTSITVSRVVCYLCGRYLLHVFDGCLKDLTDTGKQLMDEIVTTTGQTENKDRRDQ